MTKLGQCMVEVIVRQYVCNARDACQMSAAMKQFLLDHFEAIDEDKLVVEQVCACVVYG